MRGGVFDLEKHLVFYGAYHSNPINILIHTIFVWPIFFTSLILFYFTPPVLRLPVLAGGLDINFAFIYVLIFALFYIALDSKSGSVAAVLSFLCWFGSQSLAASMGFSLTWKDRFSAGSRHTTTMQAVMSFSTPRTHINKIDHNSFGRRFHETRGNASWSLSKGEKRNRRTNTWKVNALPDWPLMAVMVEHVAGSRDWVVTKSVWHLNDEEIKNVYTMYIMFTCWGCCFFASMKDPFYDGESYRKDGGDGSVYWLYEKQEDIEEQARAELWREELIEEIEKKVGGLRELEEAKEEELVK